MCCCAWRCACGPMPTSAREIGPARRLACGAGAGVFDGRPQVELSLATRPGRGCLVVQVGGVLDLATTPQVRSILQRAVDDGARNVVLDLTDVRLIDSTAL